MNENNCARYEELCSAAIDRALTEQEQQELDAHLAECPACRAYLEELRAMCALWKELETPMPAALHEKIMGEIEAEVQKTIVQTPHKQRRRPPVFTMLAAAAACVVLAVSGELTGLFGRMGTTEIQASMVDASTQTEIGMATAEAVPENPVLSRSVTPETAPDVADNSTADEAESPTADRGNTESTDSTDSADSAADAAETNEQAESGSSTAPAEIQMFTAAPEPALRTAMAEAPAALPDAVSGQSFARCYTVTAATETAELPVIEGMTLIVQDDTAAYYSVENNESKVGKVQQELEKSGYTVTLDQSAAVTTQRDAKQILMIVPQT